MEHEEEMKESKDYKGMKGFMDLGHKEMMSGIAPSSEKMKSRVYYPSLYIEKEKLPNKANVGNTMTAEVKLRLKSIEERKQDGDKKIVRCDYEVIAIKFGGSHYQKE